MMTYKNKFRKNKLLNYWTGTAWTSNAQTTPWRHSVREWEWRTRPTFGNHRFPSTSPTHNRQRKRKIGGNTNDGIENHLDFALKTWLAPNTKYHKFGNIPSASTLFFSKIESRSSKKMFLFLCLETETYFRLKMVEKQNKNGNCFCF